MQDPEILKQFKQVALINLRLTAVENVVFLLIGQWDLTVLAGSIWGWLITCRYFYMICVSVTKALGTGDPELAQKSIRASYMGRMAVIAVGLIVAFKLDFFNWIAAAVPLLFTRLSLTYINMKGGK